MHTDLLLTRTMIDLGYSGASFIAPNDFGFDFITSAIPQDRENRIRSLLVMRLDVCMPQCFAYKHAYMPLCAAAAATTAACLPGGVRGPAVQQVAYSPT